MKKNKEWFYSIETYLIRKSQKDIWPAHGYLYEELDNALSEVKAFLQIFRFAPTITMLIGGLGLANK